jgi:raffinose/stachyose/melibiose transport system substrate-binding protein
VPNTGNTTKERAAIGFINWITGPGYATYIKDAGVRPTLSGVATPPQVGLYADVVKAYSAGSAFCYLTDMPAATALGPLALQVLAGQISPQNVGDKMNVAFQAAEKQLG